MLLNEISKGVKSQEEKKNFFPLLDGYYREFFNHFSLKKNFFFDRKKCLMIRDVKTFSYQCKVYLELFKNSSDKKKKRGSICLNMMFCN